MVNMNEAVVQGKLLTVIFKVQFLIEQEMIMGSVLVSFETNAPRFPCAISALRSSTFRIPAK